MAITMDCSVCGVNVWHLLENPWWGGWPFPGYLFIDHEVIGDDVLCRQCMRWAHSHGAWE